MTSLAGCRLARPGHAGLSALVLPGLIGLACSVASGDLTFQHHFIDRDLPISAEGNGDYGLTALVDLDRDGDLDFVLGGRQPEPSRLYWFEFQAPDRWVRHVVGTNYLSDVGLAALDVDRDGWVDLVCSGAWYRNPGRPREQTFERHVFDEHAAGAHDILTADIDGDGRLDIVMMGDERTELNSLRWYSIPPDPMGPWLPHRIGPAIHGALLPGGVADLDGDGDADVIRANIWFENRDGKGREWVPHDNIPFGRKGPYGVCVRTAVVDLDGDGRKEVVMGDADIVESKVVILKNADGQGGSWTKQALPQSFPYGSLHSLAVADFNQDGKPDIVVNEQEELLPPGRENPRWVIWENQGGGRFVERIILDARLGGHDLRVGDVDGDGDIDICSKAWGPRPWNGNGGRMHVDFLENLAGFLPMFNGLDLSSWEGKPGWWRVEDGAITSESTPQKPCPSAHYLMWRGGQPGDFEMRTEFRLFGASANSGIQFRSRELPDWDTSGYQADMEGGDQWTGCLFEHTRGGVAMRGEKVVIDQDGTKHIAPLGDPKELLGHVKKNDWNSYRIVARGPDIMLEINGVVMCQVTDNQSGVAARDGVIALQMHPGPPMKVQFRNLRIRILDSPKTRTDPAK
jgi:hypothetical protein